jgi:hemolysin III
MGIHEPFNAVSHGLGAVLSLVGLVYLVYQAEGAMATAAMAVYGASLTVLYLASTLHHGVPGEGRVRRVLRRLDHTAIFLLIAGTYTPVALLALPAGWGWTLFGIVWGLTAVGVVTRNVFLDLPRWAVVGIYLAMGWTALVALKPMVSVFSWSALAWLAGGGLAYTIGAIIYATERPDPMPETVGAHGIWHLFVLAGSAFHYVFIAGYVPHV